MPVKSIFSTDTFIEIDNGSTQIKVDYADLAGDGIGAKAEDLKKKIQEFFDTRFLKTDLATDHPDTDVNPDKPWYFWGQSDGIVHETDVAQNDHLIERGVQVVNVTFADSKYVVSIDHIWGE